MSAIKNTLTQIAESISRELNCDFDNAMTLVLDEGDAGTPLVDIFDTIVDRSLMGIANV